MSTRADLETALSLLRAAHPRDRARAAGLALAVLTGRVPLETHESDPEAAP